MWKMLGTDIEQALGPVLVSVLLVSKSSQADKLLWLDMTISDTLSRSHAKLHGDIGPDLPTMEGEPLPATVLTAKADDDLLPTWMAAHIRCAVQNDIVNHKPW